MWKLLFIFLFCAVANSNKISDVSADETIQIYSTTESQQDFVSTKSSFGAPKDKSTILATINRATKHQKILGFGGTFTDATGININKLSDDLRKQVLEALFGTNGIGVNLCRVPVGSTEFSPRAYTLDDHDGDTNLEHFSLQKEDLLNKISVIRKAQTLTKGNLKLFASPWSAPLWMKNHKVWQGYSKLDDKYGKVYAEYLKKFLDEYQKNGVSYWGISTGQMPSNGFKRYEPNSMGWQPELQSKWIREHLGPILRNSSHRAIKIIGLDDISANLPYFAPVYLEDEETSKYVDGVAVHWNAKRYILQSVNNFAKNSKKELFLLGTETNYGNINPVVGTWDAALQSAQLISLDLLQNYVGWVDYNLVLDSTGGPSYVNIHSTAPIIISQDEKSFTKTPFYYALGHYSKFITPGSVRIQVDVNPPTWDLIVSGFLRPDNSTVLNVYNNNARTLKLQLSDGGKFSKTIEVAPRSISSVLYS